MRSAIARVLGALPIATGRSRFRTFFPRKRERVQNAVRSRANRAHHVLARRGGGSHVSPLRFAIMKKSVLAALLLFVVVGIAGLFVWLGSNTASTSRDPARGGPTNASRSESAADSSGASDALESSGADANARTQAPDEADLAVAKGARTVVRGRVALRGGCDDPARRVYALDAERNTNQLIRELDGRVTDDDEAEREAEADFGGGDGGRGGEDEAEARHVLAQAEIGANGDFELAVPADRAKVWITVLGRYQYVERAVELAVANASAPIAINADCGACVRGTIRLPASASNGPSADGARVALDAAVSAPMMGADGPRVRRRALVANGAFEMRALPAEPTYDVRVASDHYATSSRKVDGLRAGADTEVDVALLVGGTIRGICVSPDGAPVAQAKVRASTSGQWFGFDDRTVRSTTSKDDGSFELANVTPGRVNLRARHPNWLSAEPTKVDVADEGVTANVKLVFEQGSSISGSVKWPDGTPVAADVRVSFDMTHMAGMEAFNARRGASGKAQSEASTGAFVVGGLGKGPFSVRASAKPKESASVPASSTESANAKTADEDDEWRARIDGVTPGTKGLELVLRPAEGLRGRVTDAAGNAIPKFHVEAQRVGEGMLATLGQDQRERDFDSADGKFLLPGLSNGTWKVYASAEGFAPMDPISVAIPQPANEAGKQAEELVLTLLPACTVRGVVKDPLGAVVADAEISVDDGSPAWTRFTRGGPPPPTTRSRADGTYELTGLKAARQSFSAKARDLARSAAVSVDLSTQSIAEDVVLVLRQGGLLTGEVFNDAGDPASGWFVQCSDTTTFDQRMAFSDDRGRFRIEHLEPGKRQLVAMPTNAIQDLAESSPEKAAEDNASFMNKMKISFAEIIDGEETHVVLGAAAKGAVVVSGKVLHAGQPYSGAMVSFISLAKGQKRFGLKTASVKASGEYSVTLDGPGEYTISVQKFGTKGPMQQGVVEFVREVPEGENAKLDFDIPTGRVSGRVRDDEGNALANTRVSLHPETNTEPGSIWGGQYNETTTDDEGRYDVEALRPGTYEVLAGGATLGGMFGDDAKGGREVKAGIKVGEGEWVRDIDFRLKRPGSIEVTVVDEAGAPVPKAAIFVRTSRGELIDRFSLISTDDSGRCVCKGLAPGRYTLSTRDKTRASGDGPEIEVRSGEQSQTKLILGGGAYLYVEVVDAEKKLPLRASLSVKDEAGREFGAMFSLSEIMELVTGEGGNAGERRVGPLPAGKYRVHATLADGKSVTKPVTIGAGGERKLTIRF